MNEAQTQPPQVKAPRRNYSEDYKRQLITECRQSGAVIAAVAHAHAINASVLRRWLAKAPPQQSLNACSSPVTATPTRPQAGFIPVKLAPCAFTPSADIRIELQHGTTGMHIHWPLSASSQCAQWLREVLT
jgi:transposase